MKKALLLVSILFVSVISTACINNFAVQELNSKAKVYLDEGNYSEAIARLKSSADLDNTIFETHYNLAVAYTQAEDYPNAIVSYQKAIELDPEKPDSYYSLAVAEENLANNLENGSTILDENGAPVSAEEVAEPEQNALDMAANLKVDAINNYNIYIEKAPDAPDVEEVKQRIESYDNQPAQ